MELIDIIIQAAENYGDDDAVFAAYVKGVVDGYGLDAVESEDARSEVGLCYNPAVSETDILESLEIINGSYLLFKNLCDDGYHLHNSHLMTDGDRQNLPLNVWIEHDGKSVPVLDDMIYKVDFASDHEWMKENIDFSVRNSWKREFLHDEDLPKDHHITHFKITKMT